jgi:hypothetical protein
MGEFHIVDMISQREAVRQYSRHWSSDQLVAWLATRGRLCKRNIMGQEHFYFESAAGLQAIFFFDGDQMVFVGYHHTFV